MKRRTWIMVLAVSPVVALAADGDSRDEPAGTLPRGTSNAPVSLTTGDNSTEAADEPPPAVVRGVEPLVDSSAVAEPGGGGTQSKPAVLPPRETTASNREESGALAPKPVPWYRSGLVSLAVVLGIIGGVVWLVRRTMPSMRRMNGGMVEVLGRNHLSPRQSLTLVRIGRRLVLVGVTPERISTLCEITDPEEVAQALHQTVGSGSGTGRFEELLEGQASGFDEESDDAPELVVGSSDRLHQAHGQLQGLLSRLQAMRGGNPR